MADAPLTHSSLTLYGRQVFEYSVETDEHGGKYSQALPGFYEIYTRIDGVDVVLDRRKAPGLLADIARAQRQKDAEAPPPPAAQPQQPQQPSGDQPQPSSGDQPQPAQPPV